MVVEHTRKTKSEKPASPQPAPPVIDDGGLQEYAPFEQLSGDSQHFHISPQLVMGLQRTVGNASTQRIIQERQATSGLLPAPAITRAPDAETPIQRAVMSAKAWHSSSSKVLKSRSPLLIKIDIALAAYHKSHTQSPGDQLEALRDVQTAILNWKESKKIPALDKKGKANKNAGQAKSSRLKAIIELERQLALEATKLKEKVGDTPDTDTVDGIGVAAQQLYKRAEFQVRAALATVAEHQTKGAILGLLRLAYDAEELFQKVEQRSDLKTSPAANNAWVVSKAALHGIQIFQEIAQSHVERNTASNREQLFRKGFINGQLAEIKTLQSKVLIRVPGAGAARRFVLSISDDVGKYNTFVADIKTDKPGDFNFALIEQFMDMLDISTTMLGYQGTGGKGNEGFEEFFKSGTGSGNFGIGTKEGTRDAFSALTPSTSGGKDKMSGGSDMANAVGGLGSDAIAIIGLIKTIKDPNTTPSDKRMAIAELAVKHPLSAVSKILKFTGGALTAHRGGGNDLAGSGFGFKHKDDSGQIDVDVSTDVKMAGDFAGLFVGIFETVQKAIDLGKFIKKGGAVDAKTKRRTDRSKETEVRKDLEGVGTLLSKYTGTVSSLANNTKSVIQLGYQISGGGQNVSGVAGGVTGVANLGGVVPALGLLKGVLDLVQYSYRMVRMMIRRSRLGDKLKDIQDTGDFMDVDVVEFAREILMKRIVRLIIKLVHATVQVAAGIATFSGMGSGPAMAISLSSSAAQFAQVGVRMGKQGLRNYKAKKRLKKGNTESYADWKNRKRLESAETGKKGKMFLSWLDRKITMNWDKSSVNKEERYRLVAMQILNMDDKDINKGLGIWEELKDESDFQKRLNIVIGALKKRD